MARIRPPKGARLGLIGNGPMGDPLCNVKSADFMESPATHEEYRTEMGRWYEERRESPLYCHVDHLHFPETVAQGTETMEEIKRKQRILNKEVFGHDFHVTP